MGGEKKRPLDLAKNTSGRGRNRDNRRAKNTACATTTIRRIRLLSGHREMRGVEQCYHSVRRPRRQQRDARAADAHAIRTEHGAAIGRVFFSRFSEQSVFVPTSAPNALACVAYANSRKRSRGKKRRLRKIEKKKKKFTDLFAAHPISVGPRARRLVLPRLPPTSRSVRLHWVRLG